MNTSLSWIRCWLISVLVAGWGLGALGVEPVPESVTPTEAVPDPMTADDTSTAAVVIVYNRPIAILRCGVGDLSPAARARGIENRINEMIAKKVYGPVTIEPHREGAMIQIGDSIVMGILPCDVDPISRLDMNHEAARTVKMLQEALDQARIQHSLPFMLRAVGKTVAATVVFLLIVLVIIRINRLARLRVLRAQQHGEDWLTRHNVPYLVQVMRALQWVLRLLVLAIVLTASIQWLSMCLRWFPYTRPWADTLHVNFLGLLFGVFRGTLRALPNLLIILMILLITRGIVGIVKNFFAGVESGRVTVDWMDIEAARATRRIITVVIWLFAIVMIYPYIPGSSSAAFKGMSIFVGALVSLGSSSVVGQFTSGLVLMYSRALKPGEYVRIGDQEGTVVSLGFLSTKIRSTKNEEFHVPNMVILGTTIKNYTRLASEGGLLVHTTVTIGYDAPWRQVHALLINAAKRTPGICPEPEPFVLQTALSDFYVEYQVNACLGKPEERLRVLAALHANIQDQFNEHGVQIMSPHYLADKDHPVVVPKEQWFKPPSVGAASEGKTA